MVQGVEDRHLVIGSQLQKAREILGFSVEEVGTAVDVSAETVLAWEEERAAPTLAQLERLATLYGREVDYFLQETTESLVRYQFRSATGRSFSQISREARVVVSKFEELCRKADEIERLVGRERIAAVPSPLENEAPPQLATRLRKVFHFNGKPIGGLKEQLYKLGIRVFELPIPPLEFSGLSNLDSYYGPRILINAKEVLGRRNFTLLHEFGHLLYRHEASVCDIPAEGRSDQSRDERYADLFAVEFLLPSEPLKRDFERLDLSRTPSIQQVGKLSGRWQASVQATLYRLEDLGLIESGYARELLGKVDRQRLRMRTPKTPSWERRLGRDFVTNALMAYRAGHISLGKLASCLSLPLRKTLEIVEQRTPRD